MEDVVVELVQSIPQRITHAFNEIHRDAKDRSMECCVEGIRNTLEGLEASNSELIQRVNNLENQADYIQEKVEALNWGNDQLQTLMERMNATLYVIDEKIDDLYRRLQAVNDEGIIADINT
jgi:predicted nuclease with TOPRIM domain